MQSGYEHFDSAYANMYPREKYFFRPNDKSFYLNGVLVVISSRFPANGVFHTVYSDVVATTLLFLPQNFHTFCNFDIDCVTNSEKYLQITFFQTPVLCFTRRVMTIVIDFCFVQPWAYRFLKIMYRLNFVIGNEQMVDSLSVGALLKFFLLF